MRSLIFTFVALIVGCSSEPIHNGVFDPLPFFESPKKIEGAKPQYPSAARMHSVCGEVRVALSISMSGNVSDKKIVYSEPPGIFDGGVEKVIGTWTFEKKFNGDTAIPYQTVIPLKFKIGPDDDDCRQPNLTLKRDGREAVRPLPQR